MLCLCGFELYSRWVPLMAVSRYQLCIRLEFRTGKISFDGSYDCATQCVSQRFELKVVTVVVHRDEVIAAI